MSTIWAYREARRDPGSSLVLQRQDLALAQRGDPDHGRQRDEEGRRGHQPRRREPRSGAPAVRDQSPRGSCGELATTSISRARIAGGGSTCGAAVPSAPATSRNASSCLPHSGQAAACSSTRARVVSSEPPRGQPPRTRPGTPGSSSVLGAATIARSTAATALACAEAAANPDASRVLTVPAADPEPRRDLDLLRPTVVRRFYRSCRCSMGSSPRAWSIAALSSNAPARSSRIRLAGRRAEIVQQIDQRVAVGLRGSGHRSRC